MRSTRVTLRQLEYFVAAADTGTMSGAAEGLLISQSAVSLAIAQLERALGAQLFLRHKARGLSLTPAGTHLLVEARRLLEHAGELETSVRSLGQELSGRLTIGSFPTLTPFLMPRILRELPRRHPGVSISFRDGSAAELQEWLLGGLCEVALTYDIGIGPGIATISLYRMRPHILVAADHPLAAHPTVYLREVAEYPAIMIDYPPNEEWFTQLFVRAGITPDVSHRAVDFESVRALVARGIGWSVLAQRPSIEVSYENLPLVMLEIRDEVPDVGVVLATPESARLTQRARAFIDFCRDEFAPT
ncbi:LysR family transcriptional regulator [Pseudonocardia acaciae]|uniref:LysR family transcriptional regulator n=1 Tax=Pseudonocardia acaciae TaxID=551276 RepID=UPI00048B8F10|nr:LysR family transcriptional regulator [Pseudonocardia acaciae]